MEAGASNNPKLGSDSQDSGDLSQPGTSSLDRTVVKFSTKNIKTNKNVPHSLKGVEQAKKRLRAFSIQKKSSLSPASVPKPISAGNATVFIGKAAGVKTQPKPDPDPASEPKKPPKPPKPGTKQPTESYIFNQKKTLADIEDMKRKMELVELGIPLGLICPARSDKAMPTKAMPPIKTFLDNTDKENSLLERRRPRYIAIHSEKVDELIREAKKAKAEGKEFKFDYRKLLPDYDNPFQRNKNPHAEAPPTPKSDDSSRRRSRDTEKRRSDKTYDSRKYPSHKLERNRYRENKYIGRSSERDENIKEGGKQKNNEKYGEYKKDDRSKNRDMKSKERDNRSKDRDDKKELIKDDLVKDEKEADVDLKDFVVCDSWSDNEDKSKDSTPKLDEIKKRIEEQVIDKVPMLGIDPMDQLRENLGKIDKQVESPKPILKRLNPVIDTFKFEVVEPDDDDILDICDRNSSVDKYSNVKCKMENVSPDMQIFDYDDTKEETFDGMADDTFLESVINEIKQEELDESSQDKGLVEYDESPSKDGEIRSVTPDIDDRVLVSSRSDYSDSYKSTESGYKSTDSLKMSEYKSDSELERIVEEKKRELERMGEREMSKCTVESLETWSFVLKICQPLLFRHDRNKCYKETRFAPKLWYTENPKLCSCVKDRGVVYEELDMRKMELVDSLYSKKQEPELTPTTFRGWYLRAQQWPTPSGTLQASSEWETEDSQSGRAPDTPQLVGDISLDQEYKRFMQAVWPEVVEAKSETPRSTPVRREKKKADDDDERTVKKSKISSEGWSQESDMEEVDKSAVKKPKPDKEKRKRKHSTSTSLTDSSESDAKKRKKMQKKKNSKKSKTKDAKGRRVSKKNVKKLKEKQKKKKKPVQIEEDSDKQDVEKEKKKKDKKLKRKKQLKQKKKNQKKKKTKAKSSSSSSSSSDSEPEPERKSKKNKKTEKKKKLKKSFETQEELFDVNILKNIKTERETDDEIQKQLEFSPRRQKPREIINVKELQNDFVGNSIKIKKEKENDEEKAEEVSRGSGEATKEVAEKKEESQDSLVTGVVEKDTELQPDFKEKDESQSTPQLPPEESNLSQASSQESVYSQKDVPYEKDESHLRPSSQNSNYSFHDVMASGMYSKNIEPAKQQPIKHDDQSQQHDMQKLENDIKTHKHDIQRLQLDTSHENSVQSIEHNVQSHAHHMQSYNHNLQNHERRLQSEHVIQNREHQSQSHEHKLQNNEHDVHSHDHDVQNHEHDVHSHDHDMDGQEYEHGNYEMYEQMAMAYQSDVASQHVSPPGGSSERRIETVVRARTCGEIKCDWRAGDLGTPLVTPARPSRWGLKPGDVNIVLTCGEQYPVPNVAERERVYKIESIANRSDGSATGYDEAYMDMYGASDKLQYGDCFSTEERGAGPEPRDGGGQRAPAAPRVSSLDERITRTLRSTALSEVAKDTNETDDKDGPDKGILVTKSVSEGRSTKRVSFADGYKPGQDSDVEEPPVKKRKKGRRLGCAWPCPASHPDHVPLWDALPPPPPPPGSPPPPAPPAPPPAHLLRQGRTSAPGLLPPHHAPVKFDPNSMPAFMPPEPPPGLISFQSM